MKRKFSNPISAALVALLWGASLASAQVAPPLGVIQQFSVLGGSGVSGSTGAGTIVNGDVGSFPTCPVTNFPPSSVTPPFILHGPVVCDGTVATARANATAAFVALNQGPGTVIPDQMAGTIRTAGIYSFTLGTADIAGGGTLTLNGPGNFIFITGSTLTANVGSTVLFTGGANPCNVFWQVGSSATLNGVSFGGNIFSSASVTVGAGSNLIGRAIAGSGGVTMAGGGGNTIGGCATAPAPVCPAITVAPLTTPNGTVAVAYSQTISASGGVAPYTFAVNAGALPGGLTLTPAGLLSGTPTTAGTFNFTVRGTDANNCFGDRAYTIVIAPAVPPPPGCPTITLDPASLPNGPLGVAYSQTITASGGTAPYSFGVTSGALPGGLTLSAAGQISGTANVAGTFAFTVRATAANACFAERPYTLTIAPAVPTMPEVFLLMLAVLLAGIGYTRLRQRHAE